MRPSDAVAAQPLRLGVYFGIQPFDHFVRGEEAEVAAFTGESAEGVIQSDFME